MTSPRKWDPLAQIKRHPAPWRRVFERLHSYAVMDRGVRQILGESFLIIYLKPTVVGDEPVGIKHYHEEHPDFPQQTTTDQFFDEPQWESYRALGERIGERVLKMMKENDLRRSLFRSLAPKDGNASK